MIRSKRSRSMAKFIRRRKAEIRRRTQNREEQEKLIREVINQIDGSRKTT